MAAHPHRWLRPLPPAMPRHQAGVEGSMAQRWGSKLFWLLYWMALEGWLVFFAGYVAQGMFGE